MRYLTAGESHGKALTVIIEGIPANLPLSSQDINHELQQRQQGYGRGGRMQIEKDQAEILSGVRDGKTLGSPISLIIKNKDWENWQDKMSAEVFSTKTDPITAVRPGHADLPGMIKYGQTDLRNILERSSARETAARVAAGAVAKQYLRQFGINLWSHVKEIGTVTVKELPQDNATFDSVRQVLDNSELRCLSPEAEKKMKQHIDEAKEQGVTLGGIFEVIAEGVPAGLGSHVHWDRKLDGLIAQALISIQAIKSIEFGLGSTGATLPGDKVHDEIFYDQEGHIRRRTNNAGGVEGGISNGEPIIVRCGMKPIPTMRKPLSSIDTLTKKPIDAHFERSDNCAVPAASVVAENVMAFTLAEELQKKLGGDYLEEQLARYKLLKLE